MDKYARFEAWLRENGARFDQLELREYDCGDGSGGGKSSTTRKGVAPRTRISSSSMGEEKKETTTTADEEDDGYDDAIGGGEEEDSEMRGVHARQSIPPNTICMSIPRRCLITVEMGQATPIGQAIYNSDLDLDAPKHIYLMIYILWDRKTNGRRSFYAPYYDILPRTLHNMPIFWNDQELAHLQGSYLLHQIADRNQAICDDYETICSVAPDLRRICTLDEFKWARMCVCSRNFGLQMDGHRTSALVPHADMLNHYRPRETKWTFDEDRNAFTITTLQHIGAGAQVYDSYGQKCNHRFLLNYGFCVEDNRELDGFCPNEVPLELFVDPHDGNYSEKLEFWTRGDHHHSHHHHHHHHHPAMAAAGILSSHALITQAAQQALQAATAAETSARNSRGTRPQKFGVSERPPQAAVAAAQPKPPPQQQPHHPSAVASTVVKRVRVCVSNNENTRLLFSLLRALACDEAELRAITNHHHNHQNMSSSSTTSSSSSASSAASASAALGGNHAESASSLFGFPDRSQQPLPSSHHHPANHHHHPSFHASSLVIPPPVVTTMPSPLTGTPTPGAFLRSCRDIRHPLSLRNERAALQLLLQVVARHLALYPTSLAQDVAELQTLPRFSNIRHAKIQVRGEKQVLHHYAVWARTGLHVLNLIAKEVAAVSTSLPPSLDSEARTTGVEVKLTRTGHAMVATTTAAEDDDDDDDMMQQHHRGHGADDDESFESLIHRMEEDDTIHPTILRYCSDVLGSLRREELKNGKRHKARAAAATAGFL